MAYTMIHWVNETAPAINDTNLNHMDQGIAEAATFNALRVSDAKNCYEEIVETGRQTGVTGYAGAQAMCAIDDDTVAVAYCAAQNASLTNNGYIEIINLADGTNRRSSLVEIGHANSMTYDSKRNLFYITPTYYYVNGTQTFPSVITIINANSLAKVEDVSTPNNYTGIAYDAENDIVYCRTGSIIETFNPNSWELISSYTYDRDPLAGEQGMEYYNGYLIQVMSFNRESAPLIDKNSDAFQIYKAGERELIASIVIPDFIDDLVVQEVQELCFFPNGSCAFLDIKSSDDNEYLRLVNIFGIGRTPEDNSGINNGDSRIRRYYVNSTASGLHLGTKDHPFTHMAEVYPRATGQSFVIDAVNIDENETLSFNYANIELNASILTNVPTLILKNSRISLYGTSYPSANIIRYINASLSRNGLELPPSPQALDASLFPAGVSVYNANTIYKIGTRVVLQLSLKLSPVGNYTISGVVPAEYRPSATCEYIVSDGSATGVSHVAVTNGGDIRIYGGGAGYVVGLVMYDADR